MASNLTRLGGFPRHNVTVLQQAKIKKFQQLTDRFRGGLIKAPVYYAGVEELFGEDNVEVRRVL